MTAVRYQHQKANEVTIISSVKFTDILGFILQADISSVQSSWGKHSMQFGGDFRSIVGLEAVHI
jgi:hypothetical protein